MYAGRHDFSRYFTQDMDYKSQDNFVSNAIFEQSRWAHSGGEDLIALQANIPVRLIQTPRKKFVRCQESQLVSDALELAREGGFDHLPVTNSEGLIIGLL